MEASDCEVWLNRWIANYVNANDEAGEESRAKYPLRDAKVTVQEVPGKPGAYNAVAWMRPWLQMEELTTLAAHGRPYSVEELSLGPGCSATPAPFIIRSPLMAHQSLPDARIFADQLIALIDDALNGR